MLINACIISCCKKKGAWIKRQKSKRQLPARSGRGTPPTNMVFRGSRGWEPSITKSLSFRFQGRIWTCHTHTQNQTQLQESAALSESQVKVTTVSFTDLITVLRGVGGVACVCVCVLCACVHSHWPACLWWWGWTHRGTACRPPRCRRRSKPAPSSRPGTAGRRSLCQTQQGYSGWEETGGGGVGEGGALIGSD